MSNNNPPGALKRSKQSREKKYITVNDILNFIPTVQERHKPVLYDRPMHNKTSSWDDSPDWFEQAMAGVIKDPLTQASTGSDFNSDAQDRIKEEANEDVCLKNADSESPQVETPIQRKWQTLTGFSMILGIKDM